MGASGSTAMGFLAWRAWHNRRRTQVDGERASHGVPALLRAGVFRSQVRRANPLEIATCKSWGVIPAVLAAPTEIAALYPSYLAYAALPPRNGLSGWNVRAVAGGMALRGARGRMSTDPAGLPLAPELLAAARARTRMPGPDPSIMNPKSRRNLM